MDIVSVVFAQLFFLLVVGAIGGIIWFAYQTNLQQQQKTSRGARGGDRKERDRKQPKSRQAPVFVPEPEPEQGEEESEAEAEPEPEPEPEPVSKKAKKNKKKAATEEKKPVAPEKKPAAKAAPVQAAVAKKTNPKPTSASSAPSQKAPVAATKKPVEEKKEEKTDKKKKAEKKKKLQEQQAEFEASLAALQKKGPAQKTQDAESGWTKTVSKSSKRSANKEETKLSATSIALTIKQRQYPIITGPKGATLNAITEHSGAVINIEKSNRKDPQPDVPITVSIKGNPANCAAAEALIKELLAEGFTSVTHPGFISMPYKLNKPDRERALLVGPKGANIRKLQDRCNVRIHLPANRDSQEINIIGTEPSCKKAAEAIDTLLREGYSTMTHEDYVRGEVEGVQQNQYPAIIGKKGENIARIQKETGTRITVPNAKNDLTNVTIYGKEAGVNRAREMILEALSNDVAAPVVESDDPDNPWAAVNVSASEEW